MWFLFRRVKAGIGVIVIIVTVQYSVSDLSEYSSGDRNEMDQSLDGTLYKIEILDWPIAENMKFIRLNGKG